VAIASASSPLRDEEEDRMFEKVLVAIDGSPHGAHALSAAQQLAALSGAEVRVVHVREVALVGGARGGGVIPTEARAESEQLVDDAVAELTKSGLAATGALRGGFSGHVASELLEEANEWGASVMVLASRGLSDLAGLVIGSTTHKVLHLGHLPVLVVR
jgi:nucleotide-binding universal stress UspA family protein